MRRIAIDLDYTATVVPDFANDLITHFSNEYEIVILSSVSSEIGGWMENYQYRVEQMGKLGITGWDILVLADGRGLEGLAQSKKALCQQLGVDILFDDEPAFVEACREVCHVFQFHKMGAPNRRVYPSNEPGIKVNRDYALDKG